MSVFFLPKTVSDLDRAIVYKTHPDKKNEI